MKNKLILLAFLCLIMASCSDSATDEFEEANGDVTEKLISSLTILSAQDSNENVTYNFSYDSNNRLTNISDGEGTAIFVYSNGALTTVAGGSEPLNIEELYGSPFDAFETGYVYQYDDDGNPSVIGFYEYEYDESFNNEIQVEYTAEIEYDNEHNPYFYTMEAAGIIDVLDNVDIHIGLNPQSPTLIQARALLPLKNPSQLTYKDENGNIVYYVDANYTYDESNYPTYATIIGTSVEDGETSTYTITYNYVN